MTAGLPELVEVPDAPAGEQEGYPEDQEYQDYQGYADEYQDDQGMELQEYQDYQPPPSQGTLSFTAVAEPHLPGQVVVTDQTPVYSGPIYNLDSMENLPEPIESHQRLERIEGDDSDPFAAQRYRLVTTHILPPVVVYAPPQPPPVLASAPPVRQRRKHKPWTSPLGELILDPLAPDGIAVKLLLLEARAPFVVHEVDPTRESNVTRANPHGKVPCWIDSDGSCIWEAHAIVRYVNDKHGLEDQFYFTDQGPLKWRTDMALDWCAENLSLHIQQALNPEVYEQEKMEDIPGGRAALTKDYKVLTDYFLRETPFVGGMEPNAADYAICMQLLMLYSTRHPPPDRVRQYLHNTAEHVENWNDVTLPIREFCMLRQKELREADANLERLLLEEERIRRREMFEEQQREDEERRLAEEEAQRAQWEEEERRREAEDRRRREQQDRRMKEEWEMKRRLLEEKRRRNDDERRAAEEELERLEEERRRRELEEMRWREEYEERMARLQMRKNSSSSMRPQIGVEIKMLDDSDGNPDCIVCVERVIPGGPAEKAGMMAEDVIDRWNGDRLYSKDQWANKVKNSRIGQKVTLTLFRGPDPLDVVLTVAGTNKSKGSVRKVRSKTQISYDIHYDKAPSITSSPSQRSTPSFQRGIPSSSNARRQQSVTSMRSSVSRQSSTSQPSRSVQHASMAPIHNMPDDSHWNPPPQARQPSVSFVDDDEDAEFLDL